MTSKYDLGKYYEFPETDNLNGLTVEMIWKRKTWPAPKVGEAHIYESTRGRRLHWHGRSADAVMECRFTMKEASDWLLSGAPNESW